MEDVDLGTILVMCKDLMGIGIGAMMSSSRDQAKIVTLSNRLISCSIERGFSLDNK